MSERRNLARWLKCPRCGHEWREDWRKRRSSQPRVFVQCSSCHHRSPFSGYMDGSTSPVVPQPRPAAARAHAPAAVSTVAPARLKPALSPPPARRSQAAAAAAAPAATAGPGRGTSTPAARRVTNGQQLWRRVMGGG